MLALRTDASVVRALEVVLKCLFLLCCRTAPASSVADLQRRYLLQLIQDYSGAHIKQDRITAPHVAKVGGGRRGTHKAGRAKISCPAAGS